jgi:hypothetical protein
MQGIRSAAGGLAMNTLGLAFVAPALGRGELVGKPACPAAGGKTVPAVTGGRDALQPVRVASRNFVTGCLTRHVTETLPYLSQSGCKP